MRGRSGGVEMNQLGWSITVSNQRLWSSNKRGWGESIKLPPL